MHRALLRTYMRTAAHDPLPEESLEIYNAPWIASAGQPAFHRQIVHMEEKCIDEAQRMYGRMDCRVTRFGGKRDK